RMIVVRENVVHVDFERAFRDREDLREEVEDFVLVAVVPRDLTVSGDVPLDVVVEEIPDGVQVEARERCVSFPQQVFIRMSHTSSPLLTLLFWRDEPTLRVRFATR